VDRILQPSEYRKAIPEDNRVQDQMKHVDQVGRDQARCKRSAAVGEDRLAVFGLQALTTETTDPDSP